MANEREALNWFKDLAGNIVRKGDRVAVAVASKYYNGLRLGEVLEITGIYKDGEFRDIRVKVRVDMASGIAGSRWNRETGQWDSKPYIKTYDAASRVVKL